MIQTPLDKVLALRPANVASRLGPDCRIPVLNPRDLLSALGADVGLACIPAYVPSAIDGILRAAREEDWNDPGCPRVHAKSPQGTSASTTNGPPTAFWHIRQWHSPIRLGSA